MRAAAALTVLAAAALASAGKPIGPKAAWEPLMGSNALLHDSCKDAGGPALKDCLVRFMKGGGSGDGVDPAAVAFAEKLDEPGYLREFIPRGKIDLGRVHFPFRANFNDTVYFLNGEPPMIDAYGPAILALFHPNADDALLFPDGDALPERVPTFTGIRYVAQASVRRCRACAELGRAKIAYDFTDAGKYEGAKVLQGGKPHGPTGP